MTRPQFTRKDFKFIADIIKELPEQERISIANHFASKLKYANQGFKGDVFLEACGVNHDMDRISRP